MKMIAAFMLLIIGIGVLVRGWHLYKKAMCLNEWLKVPVSISSAEVATYRKSAANVFLDFYYPGINYRYEVNGNIYESESVTPDSEACCFSSRQDAEELLLSIKNMHTAYVNPDNFSESFLTKFVSPERKAHYRGLLVSGTLLAVTGMLVLTMA